MTMTNPAIAGREAILRLEDALRHMPQIDLPLQHYFIPGVYVREMLIPAGACLTGKIHKHECISIVAKGDISVKDEHGEKRLKAGDILVTPPGIKRAGYAHEDTVFITVHRTDETDVPELERELVCDTFDQYEAFQLTHEVAA